MIMSTYTWSHFREKVAPLNPWEDLEDRLGAVRSAAPRHAGDRRRTAVRPGPRSRQRLERRHSTPSSAAGSSAASSSCRPASRSPGGNLYFDPAAAIRTDLTSRRWGTDASGQKLGIDVPFFDTSCFYTHNGQPFRNAAGQPCTFGRRKSRSAPPTSAASRRRCRTLRFQNHHLLDLGLTKNFQLGSRVRLQVRVEALNATNYTLFDAGNVIAGADQRGVRQDHQHRLEHGDEAARHPARRQADVLTA